MEINLGDLGISPAMLARIQAGGGIMGKPKPKGKKKTVARKAKPTVGRRRGRPVAPKIKTPKPVAPKTLKASKPSTYGGIMASQESRDRQAAIASSDLYPEIQSANRALNKYVKEKHGNSQNSAQSDPAYQKMVKDLFALQDQAAGGGSMPRTEQPGGGGIAKAQSVVPSSDALSGPNITGVEADKRAKAYAKANNIEMDGRTPIFTSKAQSDAMRAAGFRGTARIKLSEEDMASRRAESLANETPSDKAFRESREAVLKEREENPVPTGTLNPDQYRLLKNENLMDDDDDFFEDVEGQFGEAGTVYSKGFSESVVDDVSAERAQLKRDAIAANLALGIDEPVGNVRDPNVAPINELFPDAPQAPTPPQLPEVRETYIPRNILGPSYDPKDREAYAAKVQAQRDQMQPGGNVQSGGYPTATNPFSAVPQTQFGGYGAQMPMQALNPYAGMARRNPAKTNFFPDYIQRPAPVYENLPATGMAPPPKIT